MLKEIPIKGETWKEQLQELCNRHSHLGMCDDLAALSEVDAWGLYCYLSRLDG